MVKRITKSYIKIKDEARRLATREDDMGKTWKEYFEDLYNVNKVEWVVANMHGFEGARRGNNFGGLPVRRTKIKMRVKRYNIRGQSSQK